MKVWLRFFLSLVGIIMIVFSALYIRRVNTRPPTEWLYQGDAVKGARSITPPPDYGSDAPNFSPQQQQWFSDMDRWRGDLDEAIEKNSESQDAARKVNEFGAWFVIILGVGALVCALAVPRKRCQHPAEEPESPACSE